MNLLLKALVAVLIGVIVAFIVGKVLQHFALDIFWGWVAGVVAGVAYFISGPVVPTRSV